MKDVIDVNALADYVPYWVAQYNHACDFTDYFPDHILAGWQYTDDGRIGRTSVDLNEWYLEL